MLPNRGKHVSSLYTYLRATPLGELLTGTAHDAHPTDLTSSLGRRFAGRSILALHIALEKAATVRVAYDPTGNPRLTCVRNIRQRGSSEFQEVLRGEAAAIKTQWAVVVLATGWQATIGHRAARPEPGDVSSKFFRHKLLFDTPEVVVPKAQIDRIYTAIDHPVLDKSIAFSVRRRDLEAIIADVRKCGLEIAAIRIAVAAQLETWLSSEGENGLRRDLLLSDGISALLLNVEQGDFVPPRGAIEAEHPRQSVQRPAAIEADIVRFIGANARRSVTFIGPEDLCAAVKRQAEGTEIIRPPGMAAHDVHQVAILAAVRHDLNFEAREVRPPVPRAWRKFVLTYAALVSMLTALAIANMIYAARVGLAAYRLERQTAERTAQTDNDARAAARMAAEFVDANATRAWVAANYHAQQFCYRVLKDIPVDAAVDRVTVEVRDGQITLTFVVLGDEATQLETHRAIERAIKDLKFKIGGEELPVGAIGGGKTVQYRMHIIVPDAGEISST